MSAEMNGEGPAQEVIDEEGDVDKALKKRIIQSQDRVEETLISLWRNAAVDPQVNLSEPEKVYIYGMTVKQYLRRIEPILRTQNVPENEYYYEEIELATVPLVPPDMNGYQFSDVADQSRSDGELRRMIGLPRGVDLPEPKTVSFVGLKDVIEHDEILSYQWEVCVDNTGAAPNHKYVYPAVERPVPKRVYVESMRAAYMFLQGAGIAVDTDTKGSEIIRNFDMSGEEPRAEYGTAEYDASPDI